MIKKYLIRFVFITLCIFAVIVSVGIFTKIRTKKVAHSKIQVLPHVKLFTMDSLSYSFPSSALAIVFFNSDCEHCQYQLNEVIKKQNLFSDKKIVFISSENISVIKNVSDGFDVAHLANIHFVKINANDAFDAFGSLYIPHIFIYGDDKKLIKEFKGETKAEAILKYLP